MHDDKLVSLQNTYIIGILPIYSLSTNCTLFIEHSKHCIWYVKLHLYKRITVYTSVRIDILKNDMQYPNAGRVSYCVFFFVVVAFVASRTLHKCKSYSN